MDERNHAHFFSVFTTAMESNYQGYLFQTEIRDKWRQTALDLPLINQHGSPTFVSLKSQQ